MTDAPVSEGVADFVRRINVQAHEQQLRSVDELFKHGKHLEDQLKEANSKNELLQQEIMHNEGAIREVYREKLEIMERYDSLQKELGVTEHKLAESQRMASNIQQQNLENTEQESSSANQTIETLRAEHKSELYRIEEKFTGHDKTLYPAFQRHIRIALAQNADRYTSLQSRISLIYQNLGREPQSFLDQNLSADGIFELTSVKSVWDILDTSYRNPNEEEEARATLNVLKQKNRSFGAYLAEFQKYHILSSITDEGTLIAFMRAGVSKEMRSQISLQQDVTRKYTFSEFVNLCKECQLRLDLNRPPPQLVPFSMPRNFSAEQSLKSSYRSEHPFPQPSQKPGTEPYSPATGSDLAPLGGDPMVLDSATLSHLGPDGKITPAERKRRFEANLCMRCGRPGHRVKYCNFDKIRINELSLEVGETHPSTDEGKD